MKWPWVSKQKYNAMRRGFIGDIDRERARVKELAARVEELERQAQLSELGLHMGLADDEPPTFEMLLAKLGRRIDDTNGRR